MKFSLLCLSAICASTATAFVLPTQRPASVASAPSTTQLQVAAEVINGETKPRRTRQVCCMFVQLIIFLVKFVDSSPLTL